MKMKFMNLIFLLFLVGIDSFEVRDCKLTMSGMEYRGTESYTEHGTQCQPWSSQSPHVHNYGTDDSKSQFGTTNNYCRNPYGSAKKPWCYTMNPNREWDYCDIQFCESKAQCKLTKEGTEYRGTLSYTHNGKKCQQWSSMYPHKHSYFTPYTITQYGVENNYCRNPYQSEIKPWCYTTDANVRWQYCDVHFCKNTRDCMLTLKGEGYRGLNSKTSDGIKCQGWKTQSPHELPQLSRRTIDEYDIHSNYCRNPNGEKARPWCYTTDPNKKSEFCSTKFCAMGVDI